MGFEELLNFALEKGLVGVGFLFMLYMFMTKFTNSQEKIVDGLSDIAQTQKDISNTLTTLDERVRKLEDEKQEK